MRWLHFLALTLITGCSHQANDAWHGQDKAQHFIASAIITAAASEYASHQGHSPAYSNNFGFLVSISLGASKELWDSRAAGSGWSWKDFAWDIAGAATGYSLWQLADK